MASLLADSDDELFLADTRPSTPVLVVEEEGMSCPSTSGVVVVTEEEVVVATRPSTPLPDTPRPSTPVSGDDEDDCPSTQPLIEEAEKIQGEWWKKKDHEKTVFSFGTEKRLKPLRRSSFFVRDKNH